MFRWAIGCSLTSIVTKSYNSAFDLFKTQWKIFAIDLATILGKYQWHDMYKFHEMTAEIHTFFHSSWNLTTEYSVINYS